MKLFKEKLFPKYKTVTYARFVTYIRPQKYEPRRMRLTTRGNRLDYEGENSTETLVLETTKILVNGVI